MGKEERKKKNRLVGNEREELGVSSQKLVAKTLVKELFPREKPGSEPEEARLQTTSRQIVQNAILRAVQQVSRESQSRRRDARAGDTARGSLRPGAGESAKKHEK
ncbi:A-kinase anchor protein inhibitor 1 [Oryx dammah]|uniref:A-kinase anchor protein inhibitor 1 n=1 Tax=Oryx dammah TaxID=59534 RepID=UPI001A9AE9BE|nr:A-kinase anchor protein inhibitor 1 [Oryx dammah]